jgi:hypothetical protein
MATHLPKSYIYFVLAKVEGTGEGVNFFRNLILVLGGWDLELKLGLFGGEEIGV